MTIGECVARADRLRPNDISEEEKVRWAFELDAQLKHEFYPRYVQDPPLRGGQEEGEEAEEVAETPEEPKPQRGYVLSGSGPYEEMYVYYVCAKIDFASQEMEVYAMDNAIYQAAVDEFRKDYNRTHTHV